MTNKTTTADRIVHHLNPHNADGANAREISEALGIGYSTVTKNLRDLLAARRIRKTDEGAYRHAATCTCEACTAVAAGAIRNVGPTPAPKPIEELHTAIVAGMRESDGQREARLDGENEARIDAAEGTVHPPAPWEQPVVEEIPSLADALRAPIAETQPLTTAAVNALQTTIDPSLVAEASDTPNATTTEMVILGTAIVAKPVKAGSIAEMVLDAMQPGTPLTPYEISRVILKSAGAVANACKTLTTKGRLAVFTDKPVRYILADDDGAAEATETVLVKRGALRPMPFAKRAPAAPTLADAVEPEPYVHPIAIGMQADESTYLRQHPMIETYTAGLTTDDTKQDLEVTIGKRTVRYWQHEPDGIGDLHKITCAVVGTVFEPDTNHARLEALDAITAPWGGRAKCGAANVAWSHDSRRLADCDTWLRVTLPREISAILTVDGRERRVQFLAETHNDSSRTDRFHVAVWSEHTNTAILLRGTALNLRGRHTRRSLLLTKDRIETLAGELPAQVAAYADLLRELAATFIDADECLRLSLVIANRGRDVFDVESGSEESLWERALTMYVAARGDGRLTAYQLFEAAASIEHTNLSWNEYARKLVAGETYADIALRLLTKAGAVVVASMPGSWAARFEAADQLPMLDPMPEGIAIAPWINVNDLRRAWCTTMAPDAVAADERVNMLGRITDPLHVLAIVAPYVPVQRRAEPTSAANEAVHGSAA